MQESADNKLKIQKYTN